MKEGQAGFTFVEALVAMALLLTAQAALWHAERAATLGARRAERIVREDRTIVELDTLLRRSLWRVRAPLEAREIPVKQRPNGLSVFYLDGDPLRHIDLSFRAGSVYISDGTTTERVGGLAGAAINWCAAAGRPPLVCVRLSFEGGEDVELLAAVGSWPLRLETSDGLAAGRRLRRGPRGASAARLPIARNGRAATEPHAALCRLQCPSRGVAHA